MDRQSDKYPNGSSFHQKDIIPIPTAIGFTGIYNPANSCFMNAALQCLSNTRELRDYFLRIKYFCLNYF
jgi:ubiquitin C-terminal hydrolase